MNQIEIYEDLLNEAIEVINSYQNRLNKITSIINNAIKEDLINGKFMPNRVHPLVKEIEETILNFQNNE